MNTYIPNNSSVVSNIEPRKFSKYNPNQSRRSTQPLHIQTRNQHMIANQRHLDRKSGYVMGVGGGSTIPHGNYNNV